VLSLTRQRQSLDPFKHVFFSINLIDLIEVLSLRQENTIATVRYCHIMCILDLCMRFLVCVGVHRLRDFIFYHWKHLLNSVLIGSHDRKGSCM